MKIVFFGSDQYSAIVLDHLLNTRKVELTALITTLPIPESTPLQTQLPSLLQLAIRHKLKTLNYRDNQAYLHNLADQAVLASFGAILPQTVIDLFPRGILCLHPSLLPQYRGATPIPTAIALGEKVTGITLFRLTNKVDQGEILVQSKLTIDPHQTAPELLTHAFTKGAALLDKFLSGTSNLPTLRFTKYSKFSEPIFTRRFTRQTGFVEWPTLQTIFAGSFPDPAQTANLLLQQRLSYNPPKKPITALHDLVRALTPWPGVWTNAPTNKGNLRLALTSVLPELSVHLPGKPNPIKYSDFKQYYL